jgi:hypothetical protein
LTFTGGILSVGAPTVGAAANSVNVQGGYYVNGVLQTGGATIAGSTTAGNLLTATGTSSGVFGNADLSFSSSILGVTGGIRLTNGYRPLYAVVTSNSLTTATTPAITSNNYGTHFYITNSGFATLTLPPSTWPRDANAYWVLRNATGTYLSVNTTYTGTTNGGASALTIPPANSVAIMFVSNTSGIGAYAFF